MRLALISPAVYEVKSSQGSSGECPWTGYEAPTGILTLASHLRAAGLEPTLFELDGFLRDSVARGACPDEAFELAVRSVASLDADILGFGTICGSFPLTIRLADRVYRSRPDARIILGGPQASAVDQALLREFPFIRAVIRGEADQIAVPAFEQISRDGPVTAPGVTWRNGGQVISNPPAPVVLDLDAVLSPAFDLCQYIGHCSRLPVEIGRGCPFACTFCSTNDFFRRRFRLRSPSRVLQEMRRLENQFGVTDFDLVHDMFTVDRKRVVEFCQFIEENASPYTWHVSARTDFVDPELIDMMARAGCRGLFFGVETGSTRLQRIIGKGLDIEQSSKVVEWSVAARVKPTVSLIVGFPEEDRADLDATASFGLDAARFDSCLVQFSLLAPLAGTPLHNQWRGRLIFDGIFPESSYQAWTHDESDRALIESYPDLFSSYYGVPSGMGRKYTAEFRMFLKYAVERCRWLAVALAQRSAPVADVFDRWLTRDYRAGGDWSYYGSTQFATDLSQFGREEFEPGSAASLMADYYGVLYKTLLRGPEQEFAKPAQFPRLTPGIALADFSFRPSLVIETLRAKREIEDSCLEPATLAFHREGTRILESRELRPLAAAMLRRCDGATPFSQIVRILTPGCPAVADVSAEEFLLCGLRTLEGEGLVEPGSYETVERISTIPFAHAN